METNRAEWWRRQVVIEPLPKLHDHNFTQCFEEVNDWQGRATAQLDYSGATLVATTGTGYNADGLVTGISQYSNAGSSTIADYTMLFDVDNELTQQIDHGTTTNFGYDSLDEVTSDGTASQTFDANGNNVADTVTSGNEVTYDGTYHYQHDQEGNETLKYDGSVTSSCPGIRRTRSNRCVRSVVASVSANPGRASGRWHNTWDGEDDTDTLMFGLVCTSDWPGPLMSEKASMATTVANLDDQSSIRPCRLDGSGCPIDP